MSGTGSPLGSSGGHVRAEGDHLAGRDLLGLDLGDLGREVTRPRRGVQSASSSVLPTRSVGTGAGVLPSGDEQHERAALVELLAGAGIGVEHLARGAAVPRWSRGSRSRSRSRRPPRGPPPRSSRRGRAPRRLGVRTSFHANAAVVPTSADSTTATSTHGHRRRREPSSAVDREVVVEVLGRRGRHGDGRRVHHRSPRRARPRGCRRARRRASWRRRRRRCR